MEGAGNPHHQWALDMLNGHQADDNDNDNDDTINDEEGIRRPPEARIYDKRGTVQTNWDAASMYSTAETQYPYPAQKGYLQDDYQRNDYQKDDYQENPDNQKDDYRDDFPYPESIIDMPSFSNPRDFDLPSRESSPFFGELSFWDRFRGKGRRRVGWTQSLTAILWSSWLNILLAFVPVAWAMHYVDGISHTLQFALCFIAIIPLCTLLEYGGENLALYCGKDIGDLVVITLNNAIEAILAICLLARCQLRLLQSTVVGVVLLRLLLVPGCAFIAGGARVAAQELHPHLSELNQTLLTTGVLTIIIPAAFFAALNSSGSEASGQSAVSDNLRGDLLKISRGLAVILLLVYLCSRIFLHNPPGPNNQLHEHKDAPAEFKEMVERMAEEEPELNPWTCLILLVLAVGLMAVTAEFLVQSIEPMRETHQIKEEWFGLVLLPLVSFSAECILSVVYFVYFHLKHYLGTPLSPLKPKTLAEARSIDLSIQFLIFWMPVLVLFGWFTGKPLSLLFDLFEVVLLISATFLVNYVTADAATNWAEGVMMLALYAMIALAAFFYPGQSAIDTMLSCSSVQAVLASEGVPPGSSFTNISFAGFHATLDNSQISNFTDHLRDLKKLYDVLVEQTS